PNGPRTAKRGNPPSGFARNPIQSSSSSVSELSGGAASGKQWPYRRRTAQQDAPLFVSRVLRMGAQFIAIQPGVVVPNRQPGVESHQITRSYALQGVVGLFVSMAKANRITG